MVPVPNAQEFEVTLARIRRRRTIQLFVGPLALLAVTFGVKLLLTSRTRSAASKEAKSAWLAYATCALGAPLHEGERPATRLSRIEMRLPELPATEKDLAWPARCAGHLDVLRGALARGSLLKDPGMTRLDELAAAAHEDLSPPSAPDLANRLWDAAEEALDKIPAGPAPPPDRAAPLPAEPLTMATLPPLPVSLHVAPEEADHLPADGLRLLFATPSGDSTLCSFRPDAHGAPFRTAHCADDVVPTTTDDATPGFLRNVKGRFDKFELIRPQLGADPQVLSMPAGTSAIALFGDQLVWIASGGHLFARTVPQGDAELGPPVSLGDIAGHQPELAACRTETSLIVRARSYDEAASGRVSAAAAILTGTSWERIPGDLTVPAGADVACRGREITYTYLEKDIVHQARCTPEGCKEEASEPLHLPWESGRPDRVSDVDGMALLVGVGMTGGPLVAGSVKTVRFRVAPVADLAKAPDVVVYGDAAHEGTDVTDVRVFVRQRAALVLVTSDDHEPFRAFTVSAQGAFEPLLVPKL